MSRNGRIVTVMLAASLGATGASAQSRPGVVVGAFAAEKTCTVYETLWATRYAWGTDFVRDCVKNFASIRGTVEAALAASGKLRVGTRGYTLSGQIAHVGIDSTEVRTSTYSVVTSAAEVAVDLRLRDAAGRTVFGAVLTKHADTYNGLQNNIALATARLVSFKLVPLRVMATDGKHITVNYGAPLVVLGSTIQVTAANGSNVRYNVTAATAESATAEVDNGGDVSAVQAGSVATFIEADDAAANARRFERVDLP